MKLFLSVNEKAIFLANNRVEVERSLYLPAPASSIIHGIGKKALFDKVDNKWVYGNTDSYKESMKNVDRRAIHFPDNGKNRWSGSYWWSNESDQNPYSAIGVIITSGTKNKIIYAIEDYHISRLENNSKGYLNVVLKILVINKA